MSRWSCWQRSTWAARSKAWRAVALSREPATGTPGWLATGRRGRIFDRVATGYDRARPAYPDELIDHAFEVAGLAPGQPVLEIGCGTGQLTASLIARGTRVTAVEPGDRLAAIAREKLGDGVRFVNATFEAAELQAHAYRAAFSASAIHWVDPDHSWRRAADALAPGGTLALLSYFGLDDPASGDDQAAFRASLGRVAPEAAREWPTYRTMDAILAGVERRRDNISEVWSWLGGYALARGQVADLFGPAELAVVPTLVEQTADELNALLRTMSFWARLTPEQQVTLSRDNEALHERLGRPIRAGTVACLVTASVAERADS